MEIQGKSSHSLDPISSGKRKGQEITSDGDTKKLKQEESACVTSTHPKWHTLESFKFVKVLKDDAQTKTLCVLARAKKSDLKSQCQSESQYALVKENPNSGGKEPIPAHTAVDESEDDVILIMEKTSFDTSSTGLQELLSSDTPIKQIFNNDIYGTYVSHPPPSTNSVKTVIIFPATAKHLEKYQAHAGDIIYETPEDYRNITLPYLQVSTFDMQWIYNILDKKKEAEFIIYEDTHSVNGYILLPDLKWDRKSLDNMYLSAIVHRHGIKSLRDLTDEHLPLLRNIQNTALKAIEDQYGVASSRIRAYFHYQPSYYHLHVHFNQIKNIATGSNVLGAHLLSDVIDNIQMQPDYYQKKTLAFVCRENALLYKCYKHVHKIGQL